MKKRMLPGMAVSLLFLSLLAGCGGGTEPSSPDVPEEPPVMTEPEPPSDLVPVPTPEPDSDKPDIPQTSFTYADLEGMDFMFSSGAGAWFTSLRIEPDGSFTGSYQDSDMGDIGDAYPNGTQYLCDFSGKFAPVRAVNDYTVSTYIESITYDQRPGEEIRDGVRTIYTLAAGLQNAREIRFFLPGAPLSELPEDFLQWAHLWSEDYGDSRLEAYGLYNVAEKSGFVGYAPSPLAQDQLHAILAAAEATDAELLRRLESDSTMTQADLNEHAAQRFASWDQCLNDLWAVLNSVLPADEMEQLRQEENAWIKEKDAAVAEAGREVEGGSLYPMMTSTTAADWTRDRACLLASYLDN